MPLFSLGRIEAASSRIGQAYVVSIAASLLVSITLTPVMALLYCRGWLGSTTPTLVRL